MKEFERMGFETVLRWVPSIKFGQEGRAWLIVGELEMVSRQECGPVPMCWFD